MEGFLRYGPCQLIMNIVYRRRSTRTFYLETFALTSNITNCNLKPLLSQRKLRQHYSYKRYNMFNQVANL